MRRLVRWGVGLLVAALLLLVIAVAGIWLASDSRLVHDVVHARIVAALSGVLEGDVSLARTTGRLGRTLVAHDLRLAVDGRTVLRVARVRIDYAPLALLHGRVHIERGVIEGLRVRAVRDATGWRVPKIRPSIRPSDGDRDLPIDIDRVELRDARAAVALLDTRPVRRFAATNVTADVGITIEAGRTEVRIASVRCTPRGIDVSPTRAAATVVVTDGGITIRGLDLATERSRITGDVHVAVDRALDGRLVTTPLAAREIRALVPELAIREDMRVEARARGPWSAVALGVRADLGGAGAVTAAARLDLAATPVRHRVTTRFVDLDPSAALDGAVHARLEGRTRSAGAGFGKTTPIAYDLKLGPSHIDGHAFRRVRVDGRGRDGVHRARGRMRVDAGEVALRGRVDLASLAYRAGARFALDHPEALVPGLSGWIAARARAEGRGVAAAERTAVLHATLDGASLVGVRLTSGGLTARLAGDTVRIERAALDAPGSHFSVAGTLDLARPATALTLDGAADLHAIAAAAGKSGAGMVVVKGTAQGPFDALAVNASAEGRGLAYSTVALREGHVALTLADVGGANAGGTSRVDLVGAQVGTRPPALVNAGLDWRRKAGTDQVAVDASARRDDGAAADLSLRLERTSARTGGQLRDLRVKPADGAEWRLVRPAGFTLDEGVTIDELTVGAGDQRMTLAGRVAMRTANDASLTLTRVSIEPLCTLAARRPCEGALSGRATLTGTPASPRLEAAFTASGLRVDKVDYGQLDLQTRYAERDATVHAVLRHPDAGELLLDGRVPVDLAWSGERRNLDDAPVDLTLSAAQLDLTLLATLAPDTLRRSSGRASLSLRVTGPRRAPRADGTIAVDAERIELVAAGVPYEQVRIRIEARGTALHVTELSATAGDGTLTGEGDVALAPGGATSVALRARFDDFFAVRRPAYEAAVSGELEVGGTLASPDIRGHLEVVRATVRPAALPASGLNLETDPTITVVKAPPAAEPPPPPPPPSFGERVRLAIDVDIARNAWIRRNDANIELGGELHLEQEPFGPLRVTGYIKLIRGWYAFQGRRFDIDDGWITFTGAAPPEPTFNVTASHRADLYTITVHVEGSGDKPTLTLSSDPPLEQADILAVLLFGKPVAQLGQGQAANLQDKALDLAAGYVMPELRTSVMNTLGLDALDVSLPGDEKGPGQVRVGRYVTGDVFVSLAQEFGAHAAEVVRVEYSLTRSISVSGSTSTRGASGIDVFWHRRY